MNKLSYLVMMRLLFAWLRRWRVGLLACPALMFGLLLPLQAHAVDMLVSNFVDTPDPAVRGGLIVYTASITNNTTDTANNVTLVFTLDAQTTFVSVSDAVACLYDVGMHKVTCSYASLAGDINGPGTAVVKTVDVTVRSRATAGTTVAARATVATTSADSNPANDILDQVTTIDNGADMALTLISTPASPASVPASSNVTLTAALVNNGPNSAGAVTATVTLSPHLTFTSASGSGWTCGAVAQVVTCTRASAAVGALPDITILTQETGAFTGTITSTGLVSITGSATDFDNTNDASTASVDITTGTDLAVTKTASASILGGGQPMSFTLAPRNSGPFAASNVTVSDTLPAGFTGISAAGTGWSCGVAGQTVTCTRASYAVAASNDITINATAPVVVGMTPFTNTATISSTTADGVAANNTSSVTVTVLVDGVDLSLTKSKSPTPVAQGANISNTLRVSNHGPRAAASGEVRIVETLPVGESFVALASGLNWTCGTQVGQTVTCTYNAALAVGADASDLVLTTRADVAGTLTNTACTNYVHVSVVDPTPANNCASASVPATSNGISLDIGITKTADLPVLAWNAPTVTYTLTLTNFGPGSATGLVLTDPIPGYIMGSTGVTAAKTGGTSTAGFACTSGATVTCTQNSGSMATGETAIFTVAVTRPLFDSTAQPGNQWVNTASVRSLDQGDFNLANNSASTPVQIDPVADVTIINTVTPGTALAGTQATYVLTVNNNGPSSANGVTVADVFSFTQGTMTFLSATPSVGTCAAFNTGTNTLNCSLGNMASGSTATITVAMRPDYLSAPTNPRTITNTATVATTTQESNVGNNSAISVLTVTADSLDLLINNTDNVDPLGFVPNSATPVFPDNVVTYRNTITNRGPSVASGLVLTYVMRPPAGKTTTFLGDKLAATGQVYSNYCNNLNSAVTGPATLTVTCTFPPGQILAASNATTSLFLDFHIDTQPNAAGDAYSSTASITSNEVDSVLSNNSVNQTTTIKMRVDLQLSKTARAFISGSDASTAIVQRLQPFYYVMTVTNAGPGDSQVTRVTDTLPVGMTLYNGGSVAPWNAAPYTSGMVWSTNNGTPTNGTCTGTTALTCNMGLLESGKVATIRIPVVMQGFSNPLQNCASASTSEVDPNAANNSNICNTLTMQRASISGTVYVDTNNNAAKDGGEVGISGVNMLLNGTDIYGNTVVNTPVTTNGSGNFDFFNLAPGTYTVTEAQPSGYLDGREAAGTSGGTATAVGADAISTIVLAENTAATGYLFGELQPASLSGFVFVDLNNNAQRDITGVPATDETPGITSISLTLTGTDDLGAVNTSTTTAANGAYSFANLRPGTYQVQQAVIPGVTHTGMTVGSKGGNDAATPVAANTPVPGAAKRTVSNIALVQNDAATNYNFGESGQGLGGFVYVDLNNNGVKDAGEPGIAGVAVTLSGNTASAVSVCAAISPNPCTMTTDANGAYNFMGIPASDGTGYILTEQTQASAPLSNYADGIDSVGSVNGTPTGSMINDRFSGIVIGLGQLGSNYNFGELAASLAGNVYLDVDQSNSSTAGDTPIAGVSVTLSGTTLSGANVCTIIASCSKTSDASGNFSFTALPASNGAGYTLTETQPLDFAEAANTPGTGVASAGTASTVASTSVFSGVVLNAGQSGINYLFGEKNGSISGFVYLDSNNNGVKDGGETGIVGVTVTLSGTAAGGGTPCGTPTCIATTLADGSYVFTNVRNANGAGYTITETQPGAYLDGITRKGTVAAVSCAACVDTVANVISAIPFVAASAHANFNFGELQAASIAGRVYLDANSDALYGAGEEMLGVTLTLSGRDDLNNIVSASTTTAADGSYRFTGLRPSNGAGYTVTETQPAGAGEFPAASGTQPGTVNAVAVGNAALNVISGIVLVSGNAGINYNFRENGASIAGNVYFDANSSGSKDGGETGIRGVSITLSGGASRSMVTDASGNFAFTGLLAGTYSVTQTQPDGYTDGNDLAGTSGGIINTPKNAITTIVLTAGSAATGYLFGEMPPPPLVDGSLAGMVYADLNKNGSFDAGDVALAGVTLTLNGLDLQNKPVTLTQQTNASGAYLFPVVAPGNYTLTETQPAYYADFSAATGTKVGTIGGGTALLNSVSNIVMPRSGGAALGYDFREQQLFGAISGSVYLDANRNGLRDGGETGIGSVLITLSGTDVYGNSVQRTTSTDAIGNFSFTGLPQGSYSLVETQPTLYQNGSDAAGSAGGTANAPKNTISGITLGAGQLAANYLFGEQNPTVGDASISGKVYVDINTNRSLDPKEALAGVSVTLTGQDANGNPIAPVTLQTAADGSYVFDQLVPGTYQVTQTQPPEWLDFPGNSGSTPGSAGGKPDVGPNKISDIVLVAATVATGYDFREKPGSLAGFVYFDNNNNGSKDEGEAGIGGVHVTLSGTTTDGSAPCPAGACVTVTAADGSYSFDNVIPGRYTLVETHTDLDTGKIVDGKETAGKAGGNVFNNSFGSSVQENTISNINISSSVLVANNGLVDGYLFGERVRSGPTLKPPIVSGYVWFDRTHTRVRPTLTPHEGVAEWTVTLTQNGKLICTAKTDSNGFYQFDNLHCPGYEESGLPIGSGFEIKFTKDGNNLPNVATSGGGAGSPGGGGIRNITLRAGDDIVEQNLPLDPSGVVYDSTTRKPVAGAVVTFSGPPGYDPARHLLGGLEAVQQVTGSDGLYQFFLQNDFPAGTYHLAITSYPVGYIALESGKIPACKAVLSVGPTPDPALVQHADNAPQLAVPLHNPTACVGMVPGGALSTQYYFDFVITHNSAPILNNHIPLDPAIPAGLSLTKTGDKQQVEIGQTILYTVSVKLASGSPVAQVTVRDSLPAGFSLVPGTTQLNGRPLADSVANPAGKNLGPLLAFNLGPMGTAQQAVLTYRVRVGVGSMQGDGINRAIAYACNTSGGCLTTALQPGLNAVPSNQGQYKVKLIAGVFTDQACVAGKVFVDCNHNHIQDAEELGIPGVRLYLEDGSNFTTDIEGKFSYCGLSPKSHVIKADSQTLPRGSRLTTTSNRNLADANSLWLDVKNGELIRADFAEGSCSNPVLEQVKARRTQGGVRSVESEAAPLPGLKFNSKDAAAPRQATDSADQELVKPRQNAVPEVQHAQ